MNEFLQHLGLLASIIAGLTIFKVISCKPFSEDGEDFSFKKLITGLAGNLLIAAAICAVYAAGTYWGGAEMIIVSIGNTKCSLCSALDLLLLSAIAVYGKSLVVNFAEMLGITSKEIKEEELKELDIVGPQKNEEEAIG